MNFLFYLKKYIKEIIIISEIILIVVLAILLYNKRHCENEIIQANINSITETIEPIEKVEVSKTIKIDIKGAVKKPGVYELNANSIVQDAITAAGGLKSNANTSNINLSKKLSDETVIKVYTNTEIKTLEKDKTESCTSTNIEINKCDTAIIETTPNNKNEETSTKISINTATKEELMTLTGIGESKALNIIEYRTTISKFNTIEDIMKVSGIGESAFEKIKENITI